MSDRAGDSGHTADNGAAEFPRFRSSPTPPDPEERTRTRGGPAVPSAKARRRRVTLLSAATMSCVVLLASGTAWALTEWVSGQINRSDVFGGLLEDERPTPGSGGSLTFLVIGSDSRGGLEELGTHEAAGERSDSMMLVHLNNERDRVSVVGIPRDSWVDVPGHGKDKINAAYSHGGPRLAVQTVESATDVRIDHYIEMSFSGFVDIVDALEGVEVCLPEPIDDPKAHLTMEAGTHEVTGEEALAFARTRQTSGGDLDRIDRQQQVAAAALDKALSSDTLSNPGKLTAFLDTALGSVTLDESLDTAALNRLGGQMSDLDLDDVTFTQVPVAEADYWTPRGDVAVRWEDQAARELFADINADRPIAAEAAGGSAEPADDADEGPRPQDVRLQVFNGAGTPGLGDEVRGAFADAGFRVSERARNWTSSGVAETVVRHAPGKEAAAALVAGSLPGSRQEEDPSLDEEVQVVVGANHTAVDAPTPEGGSAGPGAGADVSTARDNVCGD